MPTQEGSVPPVTYVCPICGQFMWTEGNCQPCQATEDARPKPEPKAKPQKVAEKAEEPVEEKPAPKPKPTPKPKAAPTGSASVKEPKPTAPKVKK